MTPDMVHIDDLLDLGCPPELAEQAAAFALKMRRRMVARYGHAAPLSRVEDALAAVFEDPVAVARDGAEDDPLGDFEPDVRQFAAKVAASRKGCVPT